MSENSTEDETFVYKPPSKFRLKAEEEEEEEWTSNHIKLLYLIRLYSVVSQDVDEDEGWFRELPLNVMIFEGIIEGILDFDYAPNSLLVTVEGSSRRVWLNISQEGGSAVEDLREKKLLNGLKLSTEDFQPVTAYQISEKGLNCLEQLGPLTALEEEVEKFCMKDGKKLTVYYDISESAFKLTNRAGFIKTSDINETEDVSYVSSPYLPDCIRSSNLSLRKPFTVNRSRADESAQGGNTIADELDEAVVLGDVKCMVGEWIPFGSNQIVSLNERLGALDRCKGGLFTAMIDKCPSDTKFNVPTGLTSVKILDYNFVRFINFEAEINYPEDEGIVQVENFGMHLNVNGVIIYGIIMDAICERKHDDISIDHLSRVLVDVHQDSTEIMNDLLSQFQRSLLDTVFNGDSATRDKYNCIIADTITPKMKAENYMDRGEYENELKQVLGDIRSSHDISENIVILLGSSGCLLAGTGAESFEKYMVDFLSLLSIESFIRNFFVRTFVLDKTLSEIRQLIINYEADPNSTAKLRQMLNRASRDMVLLKNVLEYLLESLDVLVVPPFPEDIEAKRLFKVLKIETSRSELIERCADLEKLMAAAKHQLLSLQNMSDSISTKHIEEVCKNIAANSKILVDASAANERASASLEVMQVILAGSFSFDIIDRISGGTLNIVVPKWVEDFLVGPIIQYPFVFFFLNVLWFSLVSYILLSSMAKLATNASGALSLRVILNKKADMGKLRIFLDSKKIDLTEFAIDSESQTMKVTWKEHDVQLWKGCPPTIELVYENKHHFILEAYFQINARKTNLREEGLLLLFEDILAREGICEGENGQLESANPNESYDNESKPGSSAKVFPVN